jgi:hypothetical protein
LIYAFVCIGETVFNRILINRSLLLFQYQCSPEQVQVPELSQVLVLLQELGPELEPVLSVCVFF